MITTGSHPIAGHDDNSRPQRRPRPRISYPLFAVGTDQRMWSQYWLDDEGWSGWIPIDGATFGPNVAPTALCRRPASVEMLCRGNDGQVHQTYWPY